MDIFDKITTGMTLVMGLTAGVVALGFVPVSAFLASYAFYAVFITVARVDKCRRSEKTISYRVTLEKGGWRPVPVKGEDA